MNHDDGDQQDTRCSNDAGLLFGQRRRRWPNNKPALVKRIEFSGRSLLRRQARISHPK